jgi:hypothetical protein
MHSTAQQITECMSLGLTSAAQSLPRLFEDRSQRIFGDRSNPNLGCSAPPVTRIGRRVPAPRLETADQWPQRQPLPTDYGLRGLGMKSQITVKINGVRIESAVPTQLNARSWNAEREITKCDRFVREVKLAVHVRYYFVNLLVFRLPLTRLRVSIWSWMVDRRNLPPEISNLQSRASLFLTLPVCSRPKRLGIWSAHECLCRQ